MMWLDVAWRAGQDQAIEPIQHLRPIQRRLQRWQQYRQCLGTDHGRTDVLLADTVERMHTNHPAVGRQTDQRGTGSLSDLTLIYCGKAEIGQMFRSFSLKGHAIRKEERRGGK